MNVEKQRILSLVDKHARKAMESEYDRSVAIAAIAAARAVVLALSDELSAISTKSQAKTALGELIVNYTDTDGLYTSGKSVIRSLYDDVNSLS